MNCRFKFTRQTKRNACTHTKIEWKRKVEEQWESWLLSWTGKMCRVFDASVWYVCALCTLRQTNKSCIRIYWQWTYYREKKRRKLKGLKQCSRERVKQASENRKEKWKTIHTTKSWLADHWTSIQIGVRFTQIKHSNDLLFLPEFDVNVSFRFNAKGVFVVIAIIWFFLHRFFFSLSPHSACEVFSIIWNECLGIWLIASATTFGSLWANLFAFRTSKMCVYVDDCTFVVYTWSTDETVSRCAVSIFFVNGTYSARSVHIPECNLQWLQPSQQQHFCTFEMFLFAM